jgi:hypothetical protein
MRSTRAPDVAGESSGFSIDQADSRTCAGSAAPRFTVSIHIVAASDRGAAGDCWRHGHGAEA